MYLETQALGGCGIIIRLEPRRNKSGMGKRKRKLTAVEKAAKRKRRLEFKTIFINGKMKRVRREPMIDGLPANEFVRLNADPVWLHQNEMWECMEQPTQENFR